MEEEIKMALAIVPLIWTAIMRWRKLERAKWAKKTEQLIRDGFLEVEGISTSQKSIAWSELLLRFEELWSKQVDGFELTDQTTWPQGVDKKTTLTERVVLRQPRLITDSYEVQAISSAIYDPRMERFHFGAQTHWRLRLMVDLFWCLFPRWAAPSPSANANSTCELKGCDEAWHILNWPLRDDKAQESFYSSTHIDAGQNNIYRRRGVPCSSEDMAQWESPDHRMLRMTMFQSLILFYCDSPGDLGPEEGATAFHPHSHIITMGAMRRLAEEGRTSMNILQAFRAWGERCEHHRDLGGGYQARPLRIPATRAIVALGSYAHHAGPAVRAMPLGQPRSIQNCKIHAGLAYFPFAQRLDMQSHFIRSVAPDSAMSKLCATPLDTFAEASCGLQQEQLDAHIQYITQETDALYALLKEDSLSSPRPAES